MKNLIITLFICAVYSSPVVVKAQIDEAKMDKDLRVASKVFETLWQGEDNFIMYNNNVEGNYIDGFGVIFSIGGDYSVFNRVRLAYNVKLDEVKGWHKPPVIIIRDSLKDAEKAYSEDYSAEFDKAKFEEVMLEFLVDYSQMIGQLKPTDKIIISTKKSEYVYVLSDEEENLSTAGTSGTTAELLKKDHNDFISGNITREQLITKIKLNKKNGTALRSKDLDLFGAMLKTVYDEAYSETYFISWKPDYERIEGVGAIYNFKVYSSYDENGLFRMPATNQRGLTGKQRNENVERLYPLFVKSLKENLIQYGRTINSLEPNEIVLLKITLTKCDSCTIPKKIQLSIIQSVLVDFNAGKISQVEALKKIKLSEQ